MTPMSVLPDQTATELLARSATQGATADPGKDQGGQFPELLGRLMGKQASGQLGEAQAPAAENSEVAASGQTGLAWKFRAVGGLGLAVRGDAAAGETGGPQASTQQVLTEAEDNSEALPDVASDGPVGAVRGEGEERRETDAADVRAPEPPAPLPVRQSPADAGPAAWDARLVVQTGNTLRAAVTVSEGQVAPALKDRLSASSAKIATAATATVRAIDPATSISPRDGADPAPRQMPSVELDGSVAPERSISDQEAASFVAGEGRITAKVLRTETHLPPVGLSLPMQQVAEQVEAELGAFDVGEAETDQTAFWRATAKPEAMTKVLHIQLQPAELGTVSVRMSLRGDQLEVQIDVARQRTAHLLQQDREALSRVLQSAGYALDGVAVHVVEPDRTASGLPSSIQHNHAASPSSLNAQPNWSQADGRPSGMPQHAEREARRAIAPSEAAAGAEARTPNSGVYL